MSDGGHRESGDDGAAAVTDERAAIWKIIAGADAAWLRGEPRGVAPLYHRDAVVAGPDGEPLAEGVDAIVQSYVEYCAYARTEAFEVLDRDVRVFGSTAVARYRFRVCYRLGDGPPIDEIGRELMVLARDPGAGGWRAVWRIRLASAGDAPRAE